MGANQKQQVRLSEVAEWAKDDMIILSTDLNVRDCMKYLWVELGEEVTSTKAMNRTELAQSVIENDGIGIDFLLNEYAQEFDVAENFILTR